MKNSFLIFVLIIFILPNNLRAQLYKCSTISESMKDNAKAVIRNYEMKTVVTEPGKMKVYNKIAITILNDSGDPYSEILLHYDKFCKISDIEATVYDKDGIKIKKIKSGDFKDYSMCSGYSLLEDNRAIFTHYTYNNYPYTIEYSYTTSYNGYLQLKSFIPQFDNEISVEKASASYTVPNNLKFKYFKSATDCTPIETSDTNSKSYTFYLDSIKTFEDEPYTVNEMEVPAIRASTNKFKIDQYEGQFDDWNVYGQFHSLLHKDRDELNPLRITEIKKMVAGMTDKKEIVKKIYKYMQNRTRYVSIQLGIGGWQPFPAYIVDQVGYGDCKALSNYTKALLNAAGIRAINVGIRAGENSQDTKKEILVDQFNHQCLCVPLENDTIWLECTNQFNPAGYIGTFTDDRYALLIDGKDSKLVRTKKYGIDDSKQMMNINVNLDKDGNANADFKINANGIQYENFEGLLFDNNFDDQRKLVNHRLGVTNNDISSITAKSDGASNPTESVNIKMKVSKYANVSNSRFFLPLNMANKTHALPPYKKRRFDFEVRRAEHDIDTLTYSLPDGYHVESLPKNADIKSEYGEYSTKIEVKDNKVIYIRDNKLFKFRGKAEKYGDFFQYIKKIAEQDNAKLVLIK